VLGGIQTLVAGITAVAIGVIYEHAGRLAAYSASAAAMLALIGLAWVLAGHHRSLRDGAPVPAPATPAAVAEL
jgi:hypothetical protein